MALSEDTQAIIDRLKAEGDLIRDSGPNSMRSVNIKLDRFEGLFKSINDNVISQTDMMRQQMGIASQQRRQEETRRQQEEVLPPEPTSEPAAGSPVNGRANGERNIDSASKSIAEALSFKNIVLGGAALFAGYNILKGFIDQKTGGGFTDMESGIGDFASKLRTFEMPDFTGTMTRLNETIDGLKTTIDGLRADIENTVSTLKDWQFWISLAIGAIGPFVAINRLLKIRLEKLRLQNLELEKPPNVPDDAPTQPKIGNYDVDSNNPNFRGWGEDGRPVFGDTPNAPRVILRPDGTPIRGGSPTKPPAVTDIPPRFSTPPGGSDTPVLSTPDGSTPRMSLPDMSTPELRGQNRPIIADNITRGGGKIGYNQGAGRFTVNPDGTGGFLSDADAIKMMGENIVREAPRYAKAYANVVKFLKFLGPPALAYEIFRVYVVMTSSSTKSQKIAAVSGIIGGMGIGFVAGGLVGAQLGIWFGPWSALIGGLLAGVAFGFGGEYIISAMVEAMFEEPEARQARYKEMQEHQLEAMRQNGSYADYLSSMERAQMGGSRAFSDSGFAPDLGFGSGGALGNSRGNYFMGRDGQMYRQDGQTYRVERMSLGGVGGGGVVINAPQISAPVVNNVEGGKSANYIQMASFGGGGGGFGSDDPYNLSFV